MKVSKSGFIFLTGWELLLYLSLMVGVAGPLLTERETTPVDNELREHKNRREVDTEGHAAVKIYGWPKASVSLKIFGDSPEDSWELRLHSNL